MPPRGVKKGTKRARQYEHIKDSLRERGASEDKAEEIAARTVNKERARHGEAREPSRLSQEDISSGRRGGLRSHRRSPARAHQRPAVRGSQVDGHQGPVDDEQGAARARRLAKALVTASRGTEAGTVAAGHRRLPVCPPGQRGTTPPWDRSSASEPPSARATSASFGLVTELVSVKSRRSRRRELPASRADGCDPDRRAGDGVPRRARSRRRRPHPRRGDRSRREGADRPQRSRVDLREPGVRSRAMSARPAGRGPTLHAGPGPVSPRPRRRPRSEPTGSSSSSSTSCAWRCPERSSCSPSCSRCRSRRGSATSATASSSCSTSACSSTLAATILLMAPAVYHRIRWQQGNKTEVIRVAHRMFLAGMAALAVAMTTAVWFVSAFLFGTRRRRSSRQPLSVVLLGLTWFALPLRGRAHGGDAE